MNPFAELFAIVRRWRLRRIARRRLREMLRRDLPRADGMMLRTVTPRALTPLRMRRPRGG